MKMQKFVIFAIKKLKMNMLQIKKYRKFREHCHYIGEYKDAAHSTWNFKYSVPKEILIVFHNRSNFYFDFIKKTSRIL